MMFDLQKFADVGEAVTETSVKLTFDMSDGSTDTVTLPEPLDALVDSSTAVATVGDNLDSISAAYANTGNATINALSKIEKIETITTLVSNTPINVSNE